MSVLVTGGTGWIGRQLIGRMTDSVVVSRNRARAAELLGDSAVRVIECNLAAQRIPTSELTGVNAVVNLMGDSIADGRWNKARKQSIRDSRVLGTQNLVTSLLQMNRLPETVVTASAIGYYGDCGDESCTETTPPAGDFLGELCVEWEQAARPLAEAGVRVVWLRIGIVLGRAGGAVEKMLTPFRLGLGGRLGSGRQWMSWIHLHDLVEVILYALNNPGLAGPVNAVTPHPVRNREFTKSLGQILNRPTLLPAPQFALQMALGEFARFLIASQRVIPAVLMEHDFEFRYPEIQMAWQEMIP